jgi:hypothetical protein
MAEGLDALQKLLELRIRSGERVVNARLKASDRALKLQTAAYDQHLAHLNNKTAEQARIQNTYLPRETYEADRRMMTALAWGVAMSMITSLAAVAITLLR